MYAVKTDTTPIKHLTRPKDHNHDLSDDIVFRDVTRISEALKKYGFTANNKDIRWAWERYSGGMVYSRGWQPLPDGENGQEEIVEIMNKFLAIAP